MRRPWFLRRLHCALTDHDREAVGNVTRCLRCGYVWLRSG